MNNFLVYEKYYKSAKLNNRSLLEESQSNKKLEAHLATKLYDYPNVTLHIPQLAQVDILAWITGDSFPNKRIPKLIDKCYWVVSSIMMQNYMSKHNKSGWVKLSKEMLKKFLNNDYKLCIEALKNIGIIEVKTVGEDGKETYSNFEGRNFSKQYKISDLHLYTPVVQIEVVDVTFRRKLVLHKSTHIFESFSYAPELRTHYKNLLDTRIQKLKAIDFTNEYFKRSDMQTKYLYWVNILGTSNDFGLVASSKTKKGKTNNLTFAEVKAKYGLTREERNEVILLGVNLNRYNYYIRSIESFNEKHLHANKLIWETDRNTGRLFTNLTNLPSVLRQFVYDVTKPESKLIEIDASCFQPFLLNASLLRSYYNSATHKELYISYVNSELNSMFRPSSKKNKTTSITINNNTDTYNSLCGVLSNESFDYQFNKEFYKYYTLTKNGQFYQHISEVNNINDVARVKKGLLINAFFHKLDFKHDKEMNVCFSNEFPLLALWIEWYKLTFGSGTNKNKHKVLPMVLQSDESKVFVKHSGKVEQRSSKFFCTIHDALLIHKEEEQHFRTVIEDGCNNLIKDLKTKPSNSFTPVIK